MQSRKIFDFLFFILLGMFAGIGIVHVFLETCAFLESF